MKRKDMKRLRDHRVTIKEITAEAREARKAEIDQSEKELVAEYTECPTLPWKYLREKYGLDPKRVLQKFNIKIMPRYRSPEEIIEVEKQLVREWNEDPTSTMLGLRDKYHMNAGPVLDKYGATVPEYRHRRSRYKFKPLPDGQKRTRVVLTPEQREVLEAKIVEDWYTDENATMSTLQWKYKRQIRSILEKHGVPLPPPGHRKKYYT